MKTRSCDHSRACLIAKSSMISSLPPGIAVPRTCGKRGRSLHKALCVFLSMRGRIMYHFHKNVAQIRRCFPSHLSIQSLYRRTLTLTLDITRAAEDLAGLPRAELKAFTGVHLEQRRAAAEGSARHPLLHLIRHLLCERVQRLHAMAHLRDLVPDHLMMTSPPFVFDFPHH
jgi:hypothetical protein